MLFRQVGRGWYEVISITPRSQPCAQWQRYPPSASWRANWSATWLPAALLGLTALTLACQRWLLVTNIELIHFPQFALLAVLFLAAGFEAKTAWLLATLAGFADETYQHHVLYRNNPNTYFDINDIVLNTIGAAWGTCLFGATKLRAQGATVDRDKAWMVAALAFSSLQPSLGLRPAAECTPEQGNDRTLVPGAVRRGRG